MFVLFFIDLSGSQTSELLLPKLMGVALAEFQNSGAATVSKSNWAAWEAFERPENPTIREHQKSGIVCDFWHRYVQDITLIKDLGMNACRFSLDWSMIEPERGQFDCEAIKHYHDLLNAMHEKNITPMVTLHHFTHPQWFEALGAFEKIENLELFKNFCVKMFQEFGSKVTLWCTLNEPSCYVFQGYINKAFPPGVFDFHRAGIVLRNMLLAHVQVYQTLKSLPGGNEAQIGLVHQYLTFEPYNGWNMLEAFPAEFMTYIFNDVTLKFLKTGDFLFALPCSLAPVMANVFLDTSVCEALPDLKLEQRPYFDFFGLNFYSRVVVQQKSWNLFGENAFVPSCMEGEVMTDMPYPLYGEGLYKAICDVAQFGKPIYITENGIADAQDNRRESFFKDYLGAVSRALFEGYDIRGWFYWTLMDNFEWNDGFIPCFGLYEVDFKTQQRTMRTSVTWLKNLLHKSGRAI